ncbi:MAG: hypothetical protein KTR28_00605 [Micavibrio sp.]|nr:hypothetical protein [Micavibrio sp.]
MIIHLGYPRCGSTSFQQALAQCNGGHFVGCNPKNKPGEYFDAEIGDFFESTFRFGKNAYFNAEKARIKNYLSSLSNPILSYEMLSLRITPFDLPTDIKLERLAQIVPDTTPVTLIIIYRPVRELILSLYKAYLHLGYTGLLDEFLSEICILKDFGALSDLDLELMHETLISNFKNCKIIIKNLHSPDAFENLLENLNLSPSANLDIQHHNQGFCIGHIENMLEFNNNQKPHKTFLSWLDAHRFLSLSSNLPEEQIFYLARHRKAMREYLENKPKQPFDESTIHWPNEILDLDECNKKFIRDMA